MVQIKVSNDGKDVDVVLPGKFEVLFHCDTVVEAVEWCEQNNYKYYFHIPLTGENNV